MSLVELRGVVKRYGEGPGQVTALHAVDLTLHTGAFTALSGPSGSGKTTLLNLIGCLDRPTEGEVLLEGTPLATLDDAALARLRAGRIGFIFQSFNLVPVLTAAENVQIALQLSGGDWPDAMGRSRAALASVGLAGMEDRRPNQLSGGQQQRVAIARALVKEPALVIADEPTANLDSHTGGAVLDLMRDMHTQHGVSFVFSTHDPMVLERAERVVTLRDGRVTDDRRPS